MRYYVSPFVEGRTEISTVSRDESDMNSVTRSLILAVSLQNPVITFVFTGAELSKMESKPYTDA